MAESRRGGGGSGGLADIVLMQIPAAAAADDDDGDDDVDAEITIKTSQDEHFLLNVECASKIFFLKINQY